MPQLFEYTTGLDCRIGFPNEHLAKAPSEDIINPSLATGVGLVINGLEGQGTGNNEQAKRAADRRKGAYTFLKNIKEWFESEEE